MSLFSSIWAFEAQVLFFFDDVLVFTCCAKNNTSVVGFVIWAAGLLWGAGRWLVLPAGSGTQPQGMREWLGYLEWVSKKGISSGDSQFQ